MEYQETGDIGAYLKAMGNMGRKGKDPHSANKEIIAEGVSIRSYRVKTVIFYINISVLKYKHGHRKSCILQKTTFVCTSAQMEYEDVTFYKF